MRRDPMSEKMDMYELKLSLFDNSEQEELLLFLQDFNMTLEALGDFLDNEQLRYLHTILHGWSQN